MKMSVPAFALLAALLPGAVPGTAQQNTAAPQATAKATPVTDQML